MALQEVQQFITQYLRDATLRADVNRDGVKSLAANFGLDEKEQEILVEMELGYLEKEATGIIEERFDKRHGEFKEFIDHLANYTDLQQFFILYDQAYKTGLMTRPVEMDCFLSFATAFVINNQLPPYLVDLARFDYYYSQVSITPIENGELYVGAGTELQLYNIIKLRAPYKVVKFRYDVLSIARSEFNYYEPKYFQENPVTLFIQKDWGKATTTQIFYSEEIPLLHHLTSGEMSINELLANYGVNDFEWVIANLGILYRMNIISVKLPKHFL